MGVSMKRYAWILTAVCLLGCAAAGLGDEAGPGTSQDDFFDKASLIMTKVEIEIYKHLADDRARDEFIADFWKKRDPTPSNRSRSWTTRPGKKIIFASRSHVNRAGCVSRYRRLPS
jgi:hypothetical protein